MPETVFTARGNFASLVAEAIAARDALQGMDKTVTAKAKVDKSDVDLQTQAVNRQLDALARKVATTTLRADGSQAQREVAKVNADLDRLRTRAANIDIKANGARALAEMRAVTLEADRLNRKVVDIKVRTNTSQVNSALTATHGIIQKVTQAGEKMFGGGMASDILHIVGLLSGPLSTAFAVALVGAAGLVSVVGALGLGFGALGLVMFPVLSGMGKNIQAVTKAQTAMNNAVTQKDKLDALKQMQDAYAKIPAAQRPVIQQILDMRDALGKIGNEVMPTVLKAFSSFLNGAKAILPFVASLAHATADALALLGDRFQKAAERAANSPYWRQVIKVIGQELPTYILDLGRIFGNVFSGLVSLIAQFAPAGQSMLDWIIRLTDKFREWAQNSSGGEIRKLLEYIHTNGPALAKTAGDVAKALGDTAIALSKLPLSGVTLKVIDDLAKALDAIVKTPVGAWAIGLLLMSTGLAKIVGTIAGKVGMIIDFGRGLLLAGEGEAVFSAGAYSAGAALDFLLGPIGLIILAVVAVGVAIYAIVKYWKDISDFLHKNSWVQWLMGAFAMLLGPIGAVIAIAILMAMHWRGIWNFMQQVADWFRTFFVNTWHIVTNVWHGFVDAIHTLWNDVLKPVFTAIVDVIHWVADNWSNIWRIIVLVVFNYLGAIVLFIIHNFNTIRDIIVGVMMFIWHDIIEPVWHGIRDAIVAVMDFIWHNIIEPYWHTIQAIISFVVNTIWHGVIEPAFNGIKNAIEGAMNFIWHNVIEPIWNFISNKIGEVVGFIWHNIIQPAWDAISGTTDRVFNDIKNFIVNHLQDALNLGKGIVNGIIHAINWITGGIEKIAGLIGIDIKGDLHIPDLAEAGAKMGAKVDLMAGGGCMDCELGRAMAGGTGRIGAGFMTSGPQAIVGEGRQMYPEYVIPTDPIYAGNARRLTASLLGDLGMMAAGGTLGPLASGPERIGSLKGWQGTGIFGVHWSDIPGSGIVKDVWHGAGDLVGDVGRLIRNGIAAGIEEVAHLVGYRWDETPPLWAPVVRGAMVGGTGNKLVDTALNFIRGKEAAVKAAGAGIGNAGPMPAGACMDWIVQGLNWPGANKSFGVPCMAGRVRNESNCNPRAVNLTDSNALAGHPSVGLTQFIPSTFASHSCPGCNDIWNPVCQVCASSKCSPSNCGVGGYGCAAGGLLGDALLPDISALDKGQHRQSYLAALSSMVHRPLGTSTGELMLINEAKMAKGGRLSASAILSGMTGSLGMKQGGMMARVPRFETGGIPGGAHTNNVTNNIYNPVGEPAEDSLSGTMHKLAVRGVFR